MHRAEVTGAVVPSDQAPGRRRAHGGASDHPRGASGYSVLSTTRNLALPLIMRS